MVNEWKLKRYCAHTLGCSHYDAQTVRCSHTMMLTHCGAQTRPKVELSYWCSEWFSNRCSTDVHIFHAWSILQQKNNVQKLHNHIIHNICRGIPIYMYFNYSNTTCYAKLTFTKTALHIGITDQDHSCHVYQITNNWKENLTMQCVEIIPVRL